MIITLSILAALLLVMLIAKINSSVQFNNEVKELFYKSKSISDQTYHEKMLSDLPAPVKRYFKYALKDGQSFISYARIKHNGQFKTGLYKDWINIKGEQYATTQKPGFIWKGTTSMFTARDMYISDRGRLVVSILSVYSVVDANGEKYDQDELLRWLGESILYPTNLLPGERLQWFAIDSKSAKLTFHYNGLSLFFIVTFNQIGEIIQLETKRYMDEKNVETWVIRAGNYKQINNLIIPTAFDVLWRLDKGDFSYAKFNITEVEYNNPEKF